jgi:hypothetical protein
VARHLSFCEHVGADGRRCGVLLGGEGEEAVFDPERLIPVCAEHGIPLSAVPRRWKRWQPADGAFRRPVGAFAERHRLYVERWDRDLEDEAHSFYLNYGRGALVLPESVTQTIGEQGCCCYVMDDARLVERLGGRPHPRFAVERFGGWPHPMIAQAIREYHPWRQLFCLFVSGRRLYAALVNTRPVGEGVDAR